MSHNNTPKTKTPARWQGSATALHAVQVAFDVEEAVMEAIRVAAFHENVSTSQQIRSVLGLPVAARPKRPRLTVTLDESDYALLADRYGLAPDDRLGIKEAATRELIAFVPPPVPARAARSTPIARTAPHPRSSPARKRKT